jgi:hypothetical protein
MHHKPSQSRPARIAPIPILAGTAASLSRRPNTRSAIATRRINSMPTSSANVPTLNDGIDVDHLTVNKIPSFSPARCKMDIHTVPVLYWPTSPVEYLLQNRSLKHSKQPFTKQNICAILVVYEGLITTISCDSPIMAVEIQGGNVVLNASGNRLFGFCNEPSATRENGCKSAAVFRLTILPPLKRQVARRRATCTGTGDMMEMSP